MTTGALCVSLIGCSWAALAWLVQGMSALDRQRCQAVLRRCAAVLDREARLLGRALRRLAPRRALDAHRAVGLGDISEMIDIVRLGLSAGLSFDAALGLFCSQRTGPLATCLSQARLSWQLGLGTREEELARAAWELGARPLESFAATVSQALALGAPLSETLAGQSREIRSAHRAEVEREIERIPVKLLIPTGTLILPALLLSIVGPLLAASGML